MLLSFTSLDSNSISKETEVTNIGRKKIMELINGRGIPKCNWLLNQHFFLHEHVDKQII